MKIICVGLALCFILLSGCAAAQSQQSDELAKAVAIDLNIRDGKITERGTRVVYGYPPDNIANLDFRVELEGEDAQVLETLGIEDPRILYYDDSAVLLDDVDFSIIVPFYEELAGVNVYNGTTGERLITVEIEPAIDEFCTRYPNDPSCTGAAGAAPTPAPLPWGLAVLSCIAAALIGMHWKRDR